MALGSSNSMGQARGKNKAVVVKRRKEVVTARRYTQILASDVQRASACVLNTRSACTKSYYHDGSAALPQVGDKVYSRQRANEKFLLLAGHYKTTNGVLHQSFEIDRRGSVTAVTPCKS